MPVLWAKSICVFPSAEVTFLRRSRAAPLSIVSPYGIYAAPKFSKNLLAFLPKKRHRLAILQCYEKRYQPWPQILSGKEWPQLRRVHLEGVLDFDESPSGLLSRSGGVLQPMTAPKLEHLQLSNMFLPFSAPLLRVLHLDLGAKSNRYSYPCLHGVLNILRACPLLEELYLVAPLHRTASCTNELAEDHSSSVELPRLRRFAFTSYCKLDDHILRYITIPRGVSLNLVFTSASKCSDLVEQMRAHVLPVYDRLVVWGVPQKGFTLSSSDTSCESHVSFFLSTHSGEVDMPALGSAIAQRLTDGQIRSIDISTTYLSPDDLGALRSAFKSITSVTMSFDRFYFLEQLQTLRAFALLPVLRSLTLRVPSRHTGIVPLQDRSSTWDLLARILSKLRREEQPLDTLELVTAPLKLIPFMRPDSEDLEICDREGIERLRPLVTTLIDSTSGVERVPSLQEIYVDPYLPDELGW
jgi:hypothetical protein